MAHSDSVWHARASCLRGHLRVALSALSGRHAPPSDYEIYSAASLDNLVTITTGRTLRGQDISGAPATAIAALRDYLASLPGLAPGMSPETPSWACAGQQHAYTRMALRPASVEAHR